MARSLINQTGPTSQPEINNGSTGDGPMGGTGIRTTQLGTTGDGDSGGAGGGGGGSTSSTSNIPPVPQQAPPKNTTPINTPYVPANIPTGNIKINLISADTSIASFSEAGKPVGSGANVTLSNWTYLNFGSAKAYTATITGMQSLNKYVVSIERYDVSTAKVKSSATAKYQEVVLVKEYEYQESTGDYVYVDEMPISQNPATANLSFRFSKPKIKSPSPQLPTKEQLACESRGGTWNKDNNTCRELQTQHTVDNNIPIPPKDNVVQSALILNTSDNKSTNFYVEYGPTQTGKVALANRTLLGVGASYKQNASGDTIHKLYDNTATFTAETTGLKAMNYFVAQSGIQGNNITWLKVTEYYSNGTGGHYVKNTQSWAMDGLAIYNMIASLTFVFEKPQPIQCGAGTERVGEQCLPICQEGYTRGKDGKCLPIICEPGYKLVNGKCVKVDIVPADDKINYEISFGSNFPELGDKLNLKWSIESIGSKTEIDSGVLNLNLANNNTNGKLISLKTLKESNVYFDIDSKNVPGDYVIKDIYYTPTAVYKNNAVIDFAKWTKTKSGWSIPGATFGSGIAVAVVFEKVIHEKKPELKLPNNRYDIQVKDSDNDKAFNVLFDGIDADYVDVYLSNQNHFRINVDKLKSSSNFVPFSFKKDFGGLYGQKRISLVPYSNKYGTGDKYDVVINFIAVNDFPSITEIIFPNSIDIPSFSDGDIDFNISYNSFAATAVDVDLLAKDKTRISLYKALKNNGSFKLNIKDLSKRYPTWNGNKQITLVFKPYNTAGEHVLVGNEYETTTTVFYPGLQIDETIIRKSIYDAFIDKLSFTEPEKESKYLTHLANFGNDEQVLVSTFEEDNWTLSEKSKDEFGNEIVTNEVKSVILKLYTPLPNEVQVNSTFWVTKLMTNPLIETVILNDEEQLECPPIKGPNFHIDFDFVKGHSTQFESLDSILLDSTNSNDLIKQYLSGSIIDTEDLNIEYASGDIESGSGTLLWENFVHFSSAKERVDNFVYKIQLIENYDTLIQNASSGSQTGSVATQQEIERQTTKKNQLIQGFDGFEKFLYNHSDKYTTATTSSLTWPGYYDKADKIKSKVSSSINDTIGDFFVQDLLMISGVGAYILIDDGIVGDPDLKDGDGIIIDGATISRLNDIFYVKRYFIPGDPITVYNYRIFYDKELTIPVNSTTWGSLSSPSNKIYRKANTTKLYKSTESVVTQWYNNLINEATYYDVNNSNYLINNVPQYILANEENDTYLLFFAMIGHHFDNIYFFTKAIERSRGFGYKAKGGIPDKLLFDTLKSFSWEGINLGSDEDLWMYAFGLDKEGNKVEEKPAKERSKEVWRRIINNLPYLLKHKGTRRGIYAIMACYGIPASNLSIVEFGGPEVDEDPETGAPKGRLIMDNITNAVEMNSKTAIKIPWNAIKSTSYVINKPKNIEIFLNPATSGDYTIISASHWRLDISGAIGSDYGSVKFIKQSDNIAYLTSSIAPLFNGRYFGINLQVTSPDSYAQGCQLELNLIQYSKDREIFNTSDTAYVNYSNPNFSWNSGSYMYIGSGSKGFSGSIDEIRMWNNPFTDSSIFKQHCEFPEMVNGNHASSSTTDLHLRLDFEYAKNLYEKPLLVNVAPNIYYSSSIVRNDLEDGLVSITSGSTIYTSGPWEVTGQTYSASAIGFTNILDYPYQFSQIERTVVLDMPDLGASRYSTNKVRFESQSLVAHLSPDNRSTTKTYDQSPTDSNRVGLFFSPTKELNMDIAKTFGGKNLDDYIGNPSYNYSDSYSELENIRKYYFKRIHGRDIYNYINMIKLYEKALFTDIKKMLPARAHAAVGLLIEPHFLERSKVKHTKPQADSVDPNDTIHIEFEVASENFQKEGLIIYEEKIASENLQKEGVIVYDEVVNSENYQEEGLITYIESITSENLQQDATITYVETITAENNSYDSNVNVNIIDVSSEIELYNTEIKSEIGKGTVIREIDNTPKMVGQSIIEDIGFGLCSDSGSAIRTYYDKDKNLVKERIAVYLVTETKQRTIEKYNTSVNGEGDSRNGLVMTSSFYDETTLSIKKYPTVDNIVQYATATGVFNSGNYAFGSYLHEYRIYPFVNFKWGNDTYKVYSKDYGYASYTDPGSGGSAYRIDIAIQLNADLVNRYDGFRIVKASTSPTSATAANSNPPLQNTWNFTYGRDISGSVFTSNWYDDGLATIQDARSSAESYPSILFNANQGSVGNDYSVLRNPVTTTNGDGLPVVFKPVNGYLPSHNKFTSDLSVGMRNSYYNGCKNTAATTLDGAPPVETFLTNPNALKVNRAGRDISEPILEVE